MHPGGARRRRRPDPAAMACTATTKDRGGPDPVALKPMAAMAGEEGGGGPDPAAPRPLAAMAGEESMSVPRI